MQPPVMVQLAKIPVPTGPPDEAPEELPEDELPEDEPEDELPEDEPEDELPEEPEDELPEDDPEEEDPDEGPDPLEAPASSPIDSLPVELPHAPIEVATANIKEAAINEIRIIGNPTFTRRASTVARAPAPATLCHRTEGVTIGKATFFQHGASTDHGLRLIEPANWLNDYVSDGERRARAANRV